MAGLSLLILTGWAGQISLGQFALAAVGAYVAAIVNLPLLLAVPIGACAGAAVAFIVGIPALKLRGLHLAVITLAFSLAVSSYLLDPSYLGKHLPRQLHRPHVLGISFEDDRVFFYFTVAVLVLVVLAVVGLRRSRTGRVLIAARDNERTAQSFGVSLTRVRLTAFALSGFIAALAGGLFAYEQHGVVAANFTPTESINVFLYAVIGGLGTVAGPIIGAVYMGALQIFRTSPLIAELATGLGGLGLVLLAPGGLASIAISVRDAGLRRIASRNRIVVASLISDRDPTRLDEGVAITPKAAKRGASAYVPNRYALDRQWALRIADAVVAPGSVGVSAAADAGPFQGGAGAFTGMTSEDA
jgi:branched-chain amino acid transport system permease protein